MINSTLWFEVSDLSEAQWAKLNDLNQELANALTMEQKNDILFLNDYMMQSLDYEKRIDNSAKLNKKRYNTVKVRPNNKRSRYS